MERCKKCDKPFLTAKALNMHKMRVHTRAGREGYKHRKAKPTKGEMNGKVSHDEEAAAYWVGRVTTSFVRDCEIIAARIGLTGEDFTSRCLAILSGSSAPIRTRYRLPD